ncbi:MAG: hypothetical protein ACRDA0_00800 [Cetobacterium sp.]|uniref:hypothetical protein n=1 Tax=Cetobacterium sp. TaxID=2071632 RepID=UPI003F3FAF05
MADITRTAKYRKAYSEYRTLLAKALKDEGVNLKDYESYYELIPEITRSKKLSKSCIAKKYGLTPQRIQNWIQRHNWNDLSDYIDVPGILNSTVEKQVKNNSPYGPDMLGKLRVYASQLNTIGQAKYTKKDLAELLGISEATFHKYMKRPEFKDAYEESKFGAERKWKYERALDKKAFGEEITEVHSEDGHNHNGRYSKNKEITKIIPGDTKAIIFGLENIAPDKYGKDRKETIINNHVSINLADLTDAELEKLINGK